MKKAAPKPITEKSILLEGGYRVNILVMRTTADVVASIPKHGVERMLRDKAGKQSKALRTKGECLGRRSDRHPDHRDNSTTDQNILGYFVTDGPHETIKSGSKEIGTIVVSVYSPLSELLHEVAHAALVYAETKSLDVSSPIKVQHSAAWHEDNAEAAALIGEVLVTMLFELRRPWAVYWGHERLVARS